MPQLDRAILFSQIFWLFLVFLVAYTGYTHFVLSSLLKIFLVRWWKLRKDLAQVTLKMRLLKLLVNCNMGYIKISYVKTKTILTVLIKIVSSDYLSRQKPLLKDLNVLVLQVYLETYLYNNKGILQSGTYSPWIN